jgi:hypothetical protein
MMLFKLNKITLNEQKVKSNEIILVKENNSSKVKIEPKKEVVKVAQAPKIEVKKEIPIKRKSGTDEQHKIVEYLWNKTQNIDLILTFERESGLDKNAYNVNKNGSFDKGLCQVNSNYHLDWINSKDFKDIYKQMDYCIDLYLSYEKRGIVGKRFYAYNKRSTVRDRYVITQEAYNIAYNK